MNCKEMCQKCFWVFCRCKYLQLKQPEDEEDEEEEEDEEGEENISSYYLSVVKIGEGPNGVVFDSNDIKLVAS